MAWIGGLLVGLLIVGPAMSGATAAPKPAAPAPAGWIVERVRFESLAPDGFLTASDLGDYRGAMELVRSGSGVGVINDVGVEDYVRGISEVPSSWPTEALRAQAIAARTYALNQKQNPPPSASGIGADICPTEACQVYAGLAKERAEAGARWVAAVESTRGQLLLKKGAPIRAMYYSGALVSPGGQSTPAKPAARAPAKPPAPAAPPAAPPATPTTTSPPLLGIVPANPPPPPASPPPSSPPPGSPQPAAPPPSAPAGGAQKVLDKPVFRGHGIGMSQYGALAKAQRGAGAASILSSFYGGAKLGRLPADRMPATIRVALDTGRSAVTISGPGRFRLLDEAGRALAVVATGDWRVLPGPDGKLRVVPPAGQDAALGIEALGIEVPRVEVAVPEPTPPAPDGSRLVRFRLSAPALVHVSVQSPNGETAAPTPSKLFEAGESVVAAPVPAQPGPHAVSLNAYSGVYRIASTAISTALPPAGATETASRRTAANRSAGSRSAGQGSPPVIPAAIAFVLLLGVTTALLVERLTPAGLTGASRD